MKIPKKKKGKGRFYTLAEMSDSPEKIPVIGTETSSIQQQGSSEEDETDERFTSPKKYPSTPEKTKTQAQHLELSAEELGIEVLKQDANTVVFQLKDCDNEHGVTNFHNSEHVNESLNPQTFVPSIGGGLNTETMVHRDNSGGLPLPNLCVVLPCQETILGHGMPNRNSNIQLDILSEDANTSLQKRVQNEFLGENSNFNFYVQEHSNSDILEKAFKSAMMGQGDISIDNSSLLQMLASPVKTSSPSKSVGNNTHFNSESPNKFSCITSQSSGSDQNSDQLNLSVGESGDCNAKSMETSKFSLNLSGVLRSEPSLLSHYPSSDKESSTSDSKCERIDSSSSSHADRFLCESTDSSKKGLNMSIDNISTNNNSEDVWTR